MTGKVNISTDRASGTASHAEAVNAAIASRIADLRSQQRLSFDQLAASCGVSKGMLVQIEQGRANPSIAILCKVASGLSVSLAQLVAASEQDRSPVRLVRSGEQARLWRGSKGGFAELRVGSDGPDMLELWAWELHPGERYEAQPHPAGTQELLSVSEGSLCLEVEGTAYIVETGVSAYARTDRLHSYACAGGKLTRFTMVVGEVGPGGRRSRPTLERI